MKRTLPLLVGTLLMAAPTAAAQTPAHGLRVPPGFEVVEFADAKLANDIYCMTLDPKGRIVVSGRGYIRILVDDHGDGKADRAITFAEAPRDGAMGLLWEGDSLYFTGDGGLRRFKTLDGDHASGPSELIRKMKTGGEHQGHAILRGPDGWLYVLCGNETGINKSFAELPTSPVKDPMAGCVLRFTPDLKQSEIVADGFRNAYSMDFNSDGELFTWDSDNERCVSLPWYEGTRFYHVIPGGNYGWMNPQHAVSWRRPPYFLDVVAPVIDLGRGSPTGVACYRHVQFPEKYRGGFFCCDWTFGKIWHLHLTPAGASYTAEKELFLESVGDNGFAPTACVVHPKTGDLYVSIGGRGTRGAVYRIRWTAGLKGASAAAAAKLQPKARSLNVRTEDKAELLKQAAAADGPSRLRALALMCRHADLFSKEERLAAVKVNWNDNDRSLRQACAELLRTIEVKERFELSKALKPNEWAYYTALHACVTDMGAGFSVALPAAEKERIKTPQDVEMSLATLRLIQLHFGDIGDPKKKGTVWEGYSARLSNEQRWQRLGGGELVRISWFVASLHDFVLPFLQHDEMLAILRECSRVWSMMDLDDVIKDVSMNYAAVAKKCKNPTDSLHFLIAFGADPKGNNNPTALGAAVDILLGLNPRLEKLGAQRDLHWQPRLGELHLTLSDKYPAFNDLMLKHPNFVRADHVFFTKTPGFDRKKAASLFLKKVETESTFSWNADLVALLAELPAEQSLPVLRQQWGKSGVDAALLPILARTPQPEDRPKFVEGLASSNLATVSECLEALDKLPAKKDVAETGALIRALQTLPDAKEGQGLRKWVAERLKNTTGQDLGLDGAAWLKWFAGVEPKLAARLTNPDGVDVEAWSRRFAKLEWDNGDAGRGKAVFVKANCSTCHSGAAALGPDLSGITGRFSRPDLFTAIVQPSRDVADRYRTTVIETAAGKTYQGVVAYEAVDSLILHTGPATTVRIAGNEIASRKISRISLMPAGLLDGLLDREIVDLYAYLKTNPLK